MENTTTAARSTSGGAEIREALHKVKAAHTCDHAHNDTSIKAVMVLLVAVDEQTNRKNTPTPMAMANMVKERLRETVMD